MAKKNGFEKWFREQHGPRPSGDEGQIADAIAIGKRAERLLQRMKTWDSNHESALWAWQAAEKK